MNEIEGSLEGFIDQMAEVILKHLSSLDADKAIMHQIRYGVNIVHFHVSKLISGSLYSQPHISTCSSCLNVAVHVLEHFEDGIVKGFESDIKQEA